MSNPVVRWQIIAPDPDAIARFYRDLFGWSVSQANALGYREVEAEAGEGGIGGGVWPAPPDTKPFVQLFVQVQDIDVCIARGCALGASVLVPKSVLPDGDAMAVLLDPAGMSVALCTLRSGPRGTD